MQIYRIVKTDHANLDGIGGMFVAGRWHEKGHRIIYCSESRALAVLEYMVHINDFSDLPDDLVLLTIKVPETDPILQIDHLKLPARWKSKVGITRKIGTEFLLKKGSPILQVPSVIIPEESNYLLNPDHEMARKCEIIDSKSCFLDARFKKL